ncbi:MAG: CDP-2,3-bis-(O-geranylgeranyl)-sn-glycerol synthase [Candidatus Diapherotrites archaeon]|nr:CDP-2,3-bis-(O-geranylgeranyl)-sn-glycerol synthase [Candidatus Diapherotrites archaeon]
MNPIIPVLWFLPAYVANATATFSKKFPRTHPVDGGLTLGGRRILGDGKTVEGSLIGIISGTMAGLVVYSVLGLPSPLESFLLATGAMLGDMLGSFIKRRLGLPRGSEAPLLDQLDFVIGAFLLVPPPPDWAVIILVVTPLLHRMGSILGHRMGVKNEPW